MKDYVFEDVSVDDFATFSSVNSAALARTAMAAGIQPQTVSPFGVPAIEWGTDASAKSFYRRIGKRIADGLFLMMTLPITLPIIAICAIALWIEGGNPFYRQARLGEGGKSFSIWKLRTMCRDADAMLERVLAEDPAMREEWDRTQKLKCDPRITPIGSILRKTSLDELPQLLNVLKGEMSVVGPRPMMPDQLPMYDNPTPYFDMRPGITGEWQVSDRNENSFAHRSTVDARYHAGLSLKRDLTILFQTVGVVLRRTGY